MRKRQQHRHVRAIQALSSSSFICHFCPTSTLDRKHTNALLSVSRGSCFSSCPPMKGMRRFSSLTGRRRIADDTVPLRLSRGSGRKVGGGRLVGENANVYVVLCMHALLYVNSPIVYRGRCRLQKPGMTVRGHLSDLPSMYVYLLSRVSMFLRYLSRKRRKERSRPRMEVFSL